MDISEITRLILEQGEGLKSFKDKNESRLTALEAKFGRQHLFGGGGGQGTPEERKHLEHGVRALIAGDQRKADECFREAKAMSVGTDPAGGYVTHAMLSSTMTRVMEQISPIYRLARVIDLTSGDAFEEPIDRNTAGAEWVGELQSRSDTTTPDLGLFRVELKEISALPKVSQKLVDTGAIDIIAWLSGKVGESFAVKEGTAFHDGDGIAKPRGILTYTTVATPDATRTWGQFEHIVTGASGAFPTSSASVNPADVLVDVVTALKAQYRTGAVWLMNKKTAGAARKLKDAEGRHVWVDSLTQGQPAMLLGYPVEIDEDMPDIAANSLSIAFGNIERAYTVIQHPGTKYLTDPYTDKPNVKLYAYRRVGGGVNNTEAIKFLKFGS